MFYPKHGFSVWVFYHLHEVHGCKVGNGREQKHLPQHTHAHTHTHSHALMHAPMHAHMHAHLYTLTYPCACTHTHIFMHVCTYVYTRSCIFTHMHAHTHMYTHILSLDPLRSPRFKRPAPRTPHSAPARARGVGGEGAGREPETRCALSASCAVPTALSASPARVT